MITGYNTDVEHGGVVYHVQTEDKGLQTPVILSLVYTGGAILASKRSPYDDLIAVGFDEKALTERLERQHKLICAAIHAGRIEELKRMSERADPPLTMGQTGLQGAAAGQAASVGGAPVGKQAGKADAGERFSISEREEPPLVVNLIDEKHMRAGESLTLRVEVTKKTVNGRTGVARASVTVKVLGSTFQASSTYSTTDSAGRSAISIALPAFKTGRAALLIRAEADGEVAELRRIIQPAQLSTIVQIQINGDQREFSQSSLSLNALIEALSLTPQRIAVEVNKTIVRRSDWETTIVKDGDRIEIVHFVGGGS